MSIAVSNLIWQKSRHKGSALLTLLALADWAADDGTSVYPSLETLAQKTRMTKRQTRAIVRCLESSGALVWTGAHRNRVRVYRIELPMVGAEKISGYNDGEKISAYERKRKPASADKRKELPTKAEAGFRQSVSDPSVEPSVGEREVAGPQPVPVPGSETRTPAPVSSAPVRVPDPPEQIAGINTAPPGLRTQPKPPTPAQVARKDKMKREEPAVLAYGNIFGAYEMQRLNPAQIAAVLRTATDVPRWGTVCREWAERGYKAGNIQGMLEVYSTGWRIAAPGWPGAPSGPGAGRPPNRAGKFTRPQVQDSTPDEIEQARAEARKRIAERAARKQA